MPWNAPAVVAAIRADPIVRVGNGAGQEFAMQNVAPRLSDTPGAVRHSGPRLGEHTEDVLTELGYDPTAIEHLRTEAVV